MMKLKKSDVENNETLEEREELFSELIKNGELNLDETRRFECGNFKHSLQEVLLVWFCGMICGLKTYSEIAWAGETKIEFFRRFFPYENGCPSRSTIARVIGILNPKSLDQLLKVTVKNAQAKQTESCKDLSVIAIDGKTNCGMRTTEENGQKLHMVSAFDTETGITLAQEIVANKSNEIIAIKSLLAFIEIEGKTITIDAIGTQKEITQIIRNKNGNYLLAVKGNQKKLHQSIQEYFKDPANQKSLNVATTYDKGHGRSEKRTCFSTNNIESLKTDGWADLSSIIMVKSERTIRNKTTIYVRYFITNLISNSESFLKAIRSHWGIESLHYIIDITLEEDSKIIWNKTIAENESIARRIALNLLKNFRETFRLPRKKTMESYGLIQKILFSDNDQMEALLRGTFK